MSFEKRSRSLFTACGRIITPDFFSSEELRAGQGRRPRVHGSDTLWSKGADRGQGEGVETLVTRGVVQAAVSEFNDQPDSRSHSGRPPRPPYQILGRLVPSRPYDRLLAVEIC